MTVPERSARLAQDNVVKTQELLLAAATMGDVEKVGYQRFKPC